LFATDTLENKVVVFLPQLLGRQVRRTSLKALAMALPATTDNDAR